MRQLKPFLPSAKVPISSTVQSISEGKKGLVKSLSQVEMDSKRIKGLFFWCPAKYPPSHKCSNWWLKLKHSQKSNLRILSLRSFKILMSN